MAKQKIDVEIGVKPKTKVKPHEVTKTHPLPEKESGEVTGQWYERRLMRCWNCSGLSWIWYDTESYHNYDCCFCGAVNTL